MNASHPVSRPARTTRGISIAVWLLLVLVPFGTACAQTDSSAAAPVELDGKALFHIRYGVKGYSAEFRAKQISQRIALAADDFSFDTDSLGTAEADGITEIVSGDQFLMGVLDKDAEGTGKTRQELGKEYASNIREGIIASREARSSATFLRGLLWTLLATAIVVAAFILLGKLTDRILARLRGRIRTIKIGAQDVIQASWIERVLFAATKLVRITLVVIGTYAYVTFVLESFIWTRPFARGLFNLLLGPLKTMGLEFLSALPDLIFLAVLGVIITYVIKVVKFLFFEIEKGSLKLPNFYADWARPTYKLVRTLIFIFAAVIAYPYIPGSKSAAFQGISILLGLLFSLGSSSAVANLVAGTILTYMRAFKVGDVVLIGGTKGLVVETTLLVTRLRDFKNVETAIPNSTILSSQVTNFSNQAKEGKLILPTTVTIGYDAPWRQVHAMLKLAAGRTAGISKNPEPFVLQLALEDFYVKYELNVYVDDPLLTLEVYSDLHKNIQDAFNEFGVQIMSPHFMTDKSAPVVVPREQWHAAPAHETD